MSPCDIRVFGAVPHIARAHAGYLLPFPAVFLACQRAGRLAFLSAPAIVSAGARLVYFPFFRK
jgi:hypothetical protein